MRPKSSAVRGGGRALLGTASGAGEFGESRPLDWPEPGGFGEGRVAPGVAIGEQRHQQAPRQGVARAQAAEMPDDRTAGEIQVAQRIEQLMADELVGKTQPAVVQDAAAADYDGVVERAAARQPGGAQPRP